MERINCLIQKRELNAVKKFCRDMDISVSQFMRAVLSNAVKGGKKHG
jgi:hypothetical protein